MDDTTEVADGILATATAPVVDAYGWTVFVAMVVKQVSQTVDTTAGASTTVFTMTTSLSPAIRLSL